MIKHSWLSILGSLLLATVVWISVTLSNSYTARFTAPLQVVNLPSDLAIASPLPPTIEVLLEGSGWQLLLLRMNGRLVFELPGNRLRSDRLLVFGRYLSEALKLPAGMLALQTFPETIALTMDQYEQKKVPIRAVFASLTFKPDYGLEGTPMLFPDSVLLMGAEKVLRGIHSWPTAPASFTDLAVPISEEVPLLDSLPGIVRFRRDPVTLRIPVGQLADMAFEGVPVVVSETPHDRQVLLAHPSVTIFVRGSVNRVAALTADQFGASVDFRALLADSSGAITPTVTLPEGVALLKIDPPRIRYTIRQ
jgi:YbbR domain-containing protein